MPGTGALPQTAGTAPWRFPVAGRKWRQEGAEPGLWQDEAGWGLGRKQSSKGTGHPKDLSDGSVKENKGSRGPTEGLSRSPGPPDAGPGAAPAPQCRAAPSTHRHGDSLLLESHRVYLLFYFWTEAM